MLYIGVTDGPRMREKMCMREREEVGYKDAPTPKNSVHWP